MSGPLAGQKIGFVGLGRMGWPMARRLHEAGAEVTAWNRSPEKLELASEAGLLPAPDPGALAAAVGAGTICLNLTTPETVASVVDRILPRIEAGAVLVDFGTTGYAETLALAARAEAAGAQWIDAPVSGGEVGAKAGTLTILAGGAPESFARVLPIFASLGKKITHMGGQGAGQVTKLANQLIVAQTIDAVAQALRLAELADVDPALVREALRGGFAESRILELHGDRMVRRDFAPGGRSELQLKDVRLMSALAEQVGLHSSTLANSLSLWERFVNELGHGDLDHSGLFRIYEES